MIDLSHLTEEEQEKIMTVLRRDAELKKAEDERVRKLEKILSGGPETDSKLKYLTGEWFYEAKSLRHADKIHGSDIILASMKQGKAASLDGSLKVDRSRISSSRSSDIVAPQKPARCFEAQIPNEAEKENRDTSVCSPRLPRHNPFNRASLIVVEPPENNSESSNSRQAESLDTELMSPLKGGPPRDSGQNSGGSATSDGSTVAFRPVPKKRTFLSRQTSNQTESPSPGVNAPVGSPGVVPTPRRSLQQASSGSSEQSCPKSQEEPQTPPKSPTPVSEVRPQPVQPSKPADGWDLQPPHDATCVSSNSSAEAQTCMSSEKSDRLAVCSSNKTNNSSTKRRTQQKSEEQDDQSQREHPAHSLFSRPTFNTHNKEMSSHMENPVSSEELSLPQSIVDRDPPISYDLHFIDKSDQPSQMHVFKLSTQATSPNGEEEDSIAKVLDWFSRSVDSSEWLNSDEGPETMKIAEVSALRGGETGAKKESQIKRQTTEEEKEFRGSGRNSTKELMEGKVKPSVDGNLSPEGENRLDENRPVKISHLKSFWEKSNVGPKILVSKVITPGEKGQKPAQQSAEKESEILSSPRILSDRRIPDKISLSPSDQREQQQVISPHTDMGSSFHLNDQKQVHNHVRHSPQRRHNDSTYTSDYLKLLSSAQASDQSSETETLRVTKRSPALKTTSSLEFESVAAVEPSPSPDSTLETGEEVLKIVLAPLPEDDLQTRTRGLDSEKLFCSRSSPYVVYKESVNDVQVTTKAHIYSEATDDRKGRDSEVKSLSPKAKEEPLSKDRVHSPHSNRQENTAEKIKQLKSFWEQEKNRPMFFTGKPKPSDDGKVPRGANQAKLNKRFTKSEYDLRSLGNESDSDDKYDKKNPNFTVSPLNQRLERVSPTLSASRSQFNTLRDFWDEATSDYKGTFPYDNSKSPKRKEPTGQRLPSAEPKGGDSEIYRLASAVEKTRPPLMKSSPSHQIRSKSPLDRQTGSGLRVPDDGKTNVYVSTESGQQKPQTRRGLKDSNREEKLQKSQSSPRKDMRPPKSRKDSFSTSNRNSMRRATSMFALSAVDGVDQSQMRIDVSPVHSHSRKQRQSADKGSTSRRSSEETLTLPLARAFVPTDYRHYLGMTDRTSVHTSLAPAGEVKGSEGNSEYEVSLGGPVRASTPVSSEERQCRRDSRAGQHPLWTTYSSSDTGMESSLSSTSEGSSRKTREMADEQSPVKKALWRAEVRPKNLAKSMEDITGPLSPRQERRPDPASELRRISNISSIPSSSSSLFSDSDHLKKMSKSVPSFLQNEEAGSGSHVMFENGYHPVQPSMSSMTNISSSSDSKSVTSLSGSVTTMYSGDFGSVEVQGYIQFSINYIQKLKEFHIFVAECSDLATVEPKRGRSDPYVKSYLVPDKANLGKRKTSVKKKTLNPAFNEILRYRVRMEYLRTQTLILSVWHHDTFGRNSFLGEVDVDLSKWDFDHTRMNYLALKARTTPTPAPSNGRGEMRVAIRLLPQIIHSEGKEGPGSGEIHIWVKECKNLPLTRASIDPYVKCFVLPDTSRKSRQKTRVLRRTVDPVFNHTMVYDGIRDVDLTEACVELTVWDRDRLASNLLGGLRLGAGTGRSYGAAVDWMDSSPFEVALWDRMVASPNEWVEDVLPLRVLHSAKTAFK